MDLIIHLFLILIGKELIGQFVSSEFVKEALEEFIGLAADKRSSSPGVDAPDLTKLAHAIVLKLKPDFEAAKQVTVDSVARAIVARVAQLDAAIIVANDCDPDKIASSLSKSYRDKHIHLEQGELELVNKVFQKIAEPVADTAHLLRDFNAAYSRAVLERLTDAVEQLGKLREELDHRDKQPIRDFERRYLKEVKDLHDHFDVTGLTELDSTGDDWKLTDSYISLRIEPFHGKPGASMGGSGRAWAAGRADGRLTADEMLFHGRRWIVRGDAGMGKTTLLKWIAVESAAKDHSKLTGGWRDAVPYYIRLRDLKGDNFPSAAEFMSCSVTHERVAAVPDWTARTLEAGNAIVLIDGLDELREERRKNMLSDLKRLLKLYPMARYVLSSRPHAVDKAAWEEFSEWAEAESFDQAVLLPMDMQQIDAFVDTWHKAAEKLALYSKRLKAERDWPSIPRRLKSTLRDQPALAGLAAIPLMCAMICALHAEYGGSLPRSRKDLYKKCIDVLLFERDGKRNKDPDFDYPNLEPSERRELAQRLAFLMMDQNSLHMDVEDVDLHFNEDIKLLKSREKLTGEGVRKLFSERCNLLTSPVDGPLAFRHKSFQEYLAAEYCHHRHYITLLAAKSTQTGWRETIIHACTLLHSEDCETLLLAVTDTQEQKGLVPYITALACLGYAHVSDPVRTVVVERCAPLFPPSLENADDVAAGGDPAVPLLRPTAGMAADARAACVKALMRIGTKSALDAIEKHAIAEEFLTSNSADPQWLEFVKALGTAWSAFDPAEYARRVMKSIAWHGLDGSIDAASDVDRIQALIGDGNPPADIGTGRCWWSVWLAAQIVREAGADEVARKASLVALLETAQALPPPDRALCGRVLSQLGDPRAGVGLRADGLPGIVWCDIPAGPFLYGSKEDEEAAFYDKKPLTLIKDADITRAFRISKYPVTYKQFQAFVDAGDDGYANPEWWNGLHNDGKNQRKDGPGQQGFKFDNHPRETVSWYEAMAFCRWLSVQLREKITLPTEIQWEKAARGTDGRAYPYGNEFDSARGNTYASGIGRTSAVGLFPDGVSPWPDGPRDMSGNVWEWTLTEYESRDSQDASSDGRRVLRGGSWNYGQNDARAASRVSPDPVYRIDLIGFRLASPAKNL